MEQQKTVTQSVGVPPASTAPANPSTEPIPDATGSVVKAANENATDHGEQPNKGVVLVTSTDPTSLAVAVAAIVNGIHTTGTIADLPVCPVSVITFLRSPGARDAESVKAYARKDLQAGKLLAKSIKHCRRFDPLCPGGVPHVMRYLKQGTCVFAFVDYRDLTRDDAIAALVDLKAEAVACGALVVIYVQHTKKQDVTWLRDYCMAAVEVRKCEPGPGAPVAITLENLTLASDHMLGVGRVTIEAFPAPDGSWTYRPESFIAERAVIRLAWYLAHEGMKLRDIAKIVGIAASNISRGLQSLLIQPKNAASLAPPADWRARWGRDYDLDAGSPSTMQEPAVVPSHPSTSVVLSTTRENRKV
ncbi:hypothetical protein QZM18_15725 [Burkholderia diffusa]|uniref:hypothetical protein n=1 Tax=Burkholderia diffusa TaxID=488732 RepID=UPI00264BDF91|nr:hypothetical protein [Burkholderia diffusa]MDN7905547.1 hypothetical protein [Burkholderia diffusa]